MDSSNIIGSNRDLTIAIDTESINDMWGRGDVKRILRYVDSDGFYFVRTPGTPSNKTIAEMPPIPYFTHRQISAWSRSDALDPFQLGNIKRKLLLTTARTNSKAASRMNSQRRVILTVDEDLLSYRYQLDRAVSGILYDDPKNNPSDMLMFNQLRLNIATPQEIIEIMGLSKRKRGRYSLNEQRMFKDRWVNYVILLRLPHLGHDISGMSLHPRRASEGGNLSAIKSRAAFLIAGVDSIGAEYYTGTGAHPTHFDLSYHVDYCLSLVTSMLDNLGLYANEKLSLGLDNEDISLSTSRKFTSTVNSSGHNQLFMHIHQNHPFTNMAYKIRNGVVHREGIMQTTSRGGGGGRITVNGELVPTRVFECHRADLTKLGAEKYKSVVEDYNHLTDSVLDYDRLTKWGLLSDTTTIDKDDNRVFFEPYQMIKTMVDELLDYADEFLRILGHGNILNELKSTSGNQLEDSLDMFQKHALTPFVEDGLI